MTIESTIKNDEADLKALGYQPSLRRTMSSFTSFALAFSMVSIITGVLGLFADPFNRVGGAGILLWLLVIPLVACIVFVYAHLAARIPVTGYAYQWSSRLVNKNYGWFTGWIALLSFFAGTAGTASAVGGVFAPEIWASPTQGNVQALSIAATLVACAINIFGIRIATRINDVGAMIELIGTTVLIALLIVGVFFAFDKTQGIALLSNTTPVGANPLSFSSWALACLLPVNVLLGWEGAADLAEETLDPRRAASKAMINAVAISALIGVVLFALLAMAIPGPIADFLKQPENPVIGIVRSRFGNTAATLMLIVAFASIFSCLIANVAVATRMTFALSRDKMLPASSILSGVSKSFGTPVAAIIFVTAIAIVLNLLSGGIITALYSMVGLAFYLTYFLTMLATYLAFKNGRIPDAPAGAFSLGGWLVPAIVVGMLWSICVICTFSLPDESHPGAYAMLTMLAIGAAWWALKLRGDLAAGRAGPPDTSVRSK
jgi:amino acid transporter